MALIMSTHIWENHFQGYLMTNLYCYVIKDVHMFFHGLHEVWKLVSL